MVSSGEDERSEGTCEFRSWLGVVGAWGLSLALALDDVRECDVGDVGGAMLRSAVHSLCLEMFTGLSLR